MEYSINTNLCLWRLFTGPPAQFAVTPFVVVLMVTTLVLVTCTIVVFLALKVRAGGLRSDSPSSRMPKKKSKMAIRADVRELYDTDDPNPDVIPCNKGKSLQMVYAINTIESIEQSILCTTGTKWTAKTKWPTRKTVKWEEAPKTIFPPPPEPSQSKKGMPSALPL